MVAAAVVAALLGFALAAGPAAAHGWSVDVGAQVVGDDTVIVRHLSMLEDGYLAVHAVEDGEPGRVVGHRLLEHGESEGVDVELDDGWAAVGAEVDLVAVVHTADGDGTFEWPGDDAIYRPDDPVADRFAARRVDGPSARVVASRQDTSGNVTLSLVDVPAEGFLVLFAQADDGRGDVVGVRPLPAGRHTDVAVSVDPTYYNGESNRLYLVAAIAVDDGDGAFEMAEVVTVNGSLVASEFDAAKQRESLPTPSPTTSPTPTDSPTSAASQTSTASPTSSSAATATATPDETAGPGFGALAALTALFVVLCWRAAGR